MMLLFCRGLADLFHRREIFAPCRNSCPIVSPGGVSHKSRFPAPGRRRNEKTKIKSEISRENKRYQKKTRENNRLN
jgi:hypothetical protein